MKHPILISILSIFLLLFIIACTEMKNPENTSALECKEYSYVDCPSRCVVCPPCAACSSISCQTEEFCNSIGFNKSWYEINVNPKPNLPPIEDRYDETCKNQCGDGICDEIVCQAIGCPCAEDKSTCPEDCG
jgi:hypothetical protein